MSRINLCGRLCCFLVIDEVSKGLLADLLDGFYNDCEDVCSLISLWKENRESYKTIRPTCDSPCVKRTALFRNTVLSHHDNFPRPEMTSLVFKTVSPLSKLGILPITSALTKGLLNLFHSSTTLLENHFPPHFFPKPKFLQSEHIISGRYLNISTVMSAPA